MKYTNILLSLFVTAIASCEYTGGSEYDNKKDTFQIDSVHVDERTEVIDDSEDSSKKKSVQTNLYTNKCIAFRLPKIS